MLFLVSPLNHGSNNLEPELKKNEAVTGLSVRVDTRRTSGGQNFVLQRLRAEGERVLCTIPHHPAPVVTLSNAMMPLCQLLQRHLRHVGATLGGAVTR